MIRLPPWPGKVPFTGGDTRTVVDVLLYAALLVSLVVALVLPGVRRAPDRRCAGQHRRPGPRRRAGPGDRAAGRQRPARQGRSSWPPAASSTCRRSSSSATLGFTDLIIALKLLIVVVWVGAGCLEVRRALHQRRAADGLQRAVQPAQADQPAHYRDAPRRPAALEASPGSWPTSAARSSRSSSRWCCCSRPTRRSPCWPRSFMVLLPRVHRVDVPAGGAAGVERAVRVRRGVPVRRLPGRRRLQRHRLLGAVAAAGDRRRAAVLPGARQPASRPGLVPAVDAAVRRQLGLGDLGVRARRRGAAQRAATSRRRTRSTSWSAFGYDPDARR